MNKLVNKLHLWSLQSSNSKWGPWILLICGIADASFLPLPVTTLFLALCLLNVRNILKYAIFLTSGIVTGAIIGYMIGRFAWMDPNSELTKFADFIINNFPGFSIDGYQKIHLLFTNWGSWILLAATATPIPYGLFSVSSGAFNVNIIIFIAATIAGHGAKYILLGYLTSKMGVSMNKIIEYSLKPVALFSKAFIFISVAFINIFR
jgi:membrane protein YqaA with SNARE-associated domain